MNTPSLKTQQTLIYTVLLCLLLALTVGVYEGGVQLAQLESQDVTVEELPSALFLSFLRMVFSYTAALAFSFLVGMIAATTKWGERIIIPALDILQSVPIVGFFPAAMSFFIALTQGHRMGVELAACFLIFTSQAWNMAFAVYESVKSIPNEHLDATFSFGLKPSQRFTAVYVPFCIPRLVYNSILSWTNGWFFLVACEIIAVGPARYHLPGIGSFLSLAAEQSEIRLVLWGLAALTILVIFLDFIIWRPLTLWSNRFKEQATEEIGLSYRIITAIKESTIWSDILSPVIKKILSFIQYILTHYLFVVLIDLPVSLFQSLNHVVFPQNHPKWRLFISSVLFLGVSGVLLVSLGYLVDWMLNPLPEIASRIPLAILASTGRMILALLISLAWIIPVVLFLWNRPRLRQFFMTLAQIGASLPAIALFPLFIVLLVQKVSGGMEIASLLLLLTGMQWYILFNCLGGTSGISQDIYDATRSFGIPKSLTWKRLVIPSMMPALITGAITGWGGGWNALVVAEYVVNNDQVLSVNGIGALLNEAVYQRGDTRSITFCIFSMVAWILFINLIFWRPAYRWALEKFKQGD